MRPNVKKAWIPAFAGMTARLKNGKPAEIAPRAIVVDNDWGGLERDAQHAHGRGGPGQKQKADAAVIEEARELDHFLSHLNARPTRPL